MTCHDFKRTAGSMRLRELSQSPGALATHAAECRACGVWLEEQRNLAASLLRLQQGTAALQAGPAVESAVLRAFRQQTQQTPQPEVRRSRWLAWRPAGVFAVRAYAVTAAVIALAIILGLRLWQPNPAKQQAQANGSALVQSPQKVNAESRQVTASPAGERLAKAASAAPASASADATPTSASDDADYVALMFCDPMICSADTQVVRVDLANGSSGADEQLADVVVGYDGVVRAVRMVN